jgi:DNA-binding response OmpR family regulator
MLHDESMGAAILVIEDEAKYRRLIRTNLAMAGYGVIEAADGHQALQALYDRDPDLIMLDLRLPDMDGFHLCERLRVQTAVPILAVTALSTEADTVRALDLGADDYIQKPFSPAELLARVRALIRRSQSLGRSPVFECGAIRLEPQSREVVVRGEARMRLTPTEWRLLRELVLHCGKVLTHEQLLSRVWGVEYQSEHEYLRVYIRRLRSYIEPDPHEPRYLISHAGVGYALYPRPHGGNDD